MIRTVATGRVLQQWRYAAASHTPKGETREGRLDGGDVGVPAGWSALAFAYAWPSPTWTQSPKYRALRRGPAIVSRGSYMNAGLGGH